MDATATHLSPLAHNDVLESYFELVSSAGMELAPVHTDHHVVEHDDVHSSSPTGPFRTSFLETVTEEMSQIESFVQDTAPDSLAQTTHEVVHSNPRIQYDMELWRHIREYD